MTVRLALLWLVVGLAACGGVPGDGADDSFIGPGGKADVFGVADESVVALGVLRLVNEADEVLLRDRVGLSTQTVNSIVAARAGRDGELFTRDDREVTSLSALDAIPYVGSLSFERLLSYAREHGYVDPWEDRWPAAVRVVAVGDLHGDLAATRRALTVAGAIDDGDAWIGGALVVVQTGDILDRGDDERAILDLVERLEVEAAAVGGAVIPLLGNHEVMNVDGDLRYVTTAGFTTFVGLPDLDLGHPWVRQFPVARRPRAAAFRQSGPYARRLARQRVAAVVEESLFAHAGVRPTHVQEGLARINFRARAWMLWDDLGIPEVIDDGESPVWYRDYGDSATVSCGEVAETLRLAGAARMVIGHTVQAAGITSACDDQLWRIDTGLATSYGGPIEVLEIVDGVVTVLTE